MRSLQKSGNAPRGAAIAPPALFLPEIPALRVLPLLAVLFLFLPGCFDAKEDPRSAAPLPTVEDYYKEIPVVRRTHLRMGVVAGPYGEMFAETIQPALERKGYTFATVAYADYSRPNLALADNTIDFNIFQHYAYLNNFKFEHNLDITAIVQIPTASMGIFSAQYDSLAHIGERASISLPDDPTNLARALRVLDLAGLITIDPSIDKYKARPKDIVGNPKNFSFVFEKAHLLADSLEQYDLSVINGNFAYSKGMDLSKALYTEPLDDSYINVIAVRSEDLHQPFVQDIVEAVHSEEFIKAIISPESKFVKFQRPRNFLQIVNDG